jgi:hypothetical protein
MDERLFKKIKTKTRKGIDPCAWVLFFCSLGFLFFEIPLFNVGFLLNFFVVYFSMFG